MYGKFLWGTFFCTLALFIVLSFLTTLSAEDYAWYNDYRQDGFWTMQAIIYKGGMGRYVSNFIIAAGTGLDLPARMVFLFPLLFLAGTWLALYFLTVTINRIFLNGSF